MPCLALAVSLSLASGCAKPGPAVTTFPPRADLVVEPKPEPSPEAVTSEAAGIADDIALETWGERGWRQVGRLCRWAVTNGMTGVVCPELASTAGSAPH